MTKIVKSNNTYKDITEYIRNKPNPNVYEEYIANRYILNILRDDFEKDRINIMISEIDDLDYSEGLRIILIFTYLRLFGEIEDINTYNSTQLLLIIMIKAKYPELFDKNKDLLLNKENINFAIMSSDGIEDQARSLIYLVNNPKIINTVRHFENLP